ncbi:unnamed protein product [Phytophthora lilii]|uniref:Unnamed protein product n=1 Tax=Phytophthora lilii TaxID=2077276 RepID=A0A9W6U986_9STRA|nr:unnamed protein product [Phytophthora lilii]
MLLFVTFTALAVASVAAGSVDIGQNAQVSIDALQVGDYYRPSSDEVTGYADSTSPQPDPNQVPTTFSLDIISRHNVLEHDASLVHNDAYFGGDPININETLVEDLLGRSIDGKTLGVTEVGETRRDRLAECRANNPECVFGANQTTFSYLEAAVFIVGCGGNVNESVTVEAARSFVWDERIPDNYAASAEPISLSFMQSVMVKLLAYA